MKKWIVLSLLFIRFMFCMIDAQAADLPFEVSGTYNEKDQIITLLVSVKEPSSLEAFTFAVEYDEEKYELYEANDELPGGYGYDEAFQTSYQSGMTVSNAKIGKVMFSGVNAAQDVCVYEGALATVTLLCYPGIQADLSDISLRVSTLHVNGQNVDLPEGGVLFVCEREENGQNGNLVSFVAGEASADSFVDKKNEGSAQSTATDLPSQAYEPSEQTALGQAKQTNETKDSTSMVPVSPQSVQNTPAAKEHKKDGQAVGREKKKADLKENKRTTADGQKNTKHSILNYLLLVFVIVIVIAALVARKKGVKKNESK